MKETTLIAAFTIKTMPWKVKYNQAIPAVSTFITFVSQTTVPYCFFFKASSSYMYLKPEKHHLLCQLPVCSSSRFAMSLVSFCFTPMSRVSTFSVNLSTLRVILTALKPNRNLFNVTHPESACSPYKRNRHNTKYLAKLHPNPRHCLTPLSWVVLYNNHLDLFLHFHLHLCRP